MAQGIICITPITAFKDYFGLTIELALIDLGKLKEALLLPERYTVEKVERAFYNGYKDCAAITVSSPDIPEVVQGEPLPNVLPCHFSVIGSDSPNAYNISLQDILIDGVSAIREEDKERKVTIEIKEARGTHADARSKQFQGFAKLLFESLYDQFNNLHHQEDDGRDKEAEQTKKGILETIAEAGYDLLDHAIGYICNEMADVIPYREAAELIPDLTEWPKDKSP